MRARYALGAEDGFESVGLVLVPAAWVLDPSNDLCAPGTAPGGATFAPACQGSLTLWRRAHVAGALVAPSAATPEGALSH